MNLDFNIAVHVLTFLSKHASEKFNSNELAEKVCVNPVQLRNVMAKLVNHDYVITQKGKYGGYCINGDILDTPLSELFQLFVTKQSFGRVYTGSLESDCKISNEIRHVMSRYHQKEFNVLEAFYRSITIRDIFNEILMEDYHEKI